MKDLINNFVPDTKIQLFPYDCMSVMKKYKDNYFDLAVVDPPYGIGESGKTNNTRGKLAIAKDYHSFSGDDLKAPDEEYFKELFRVSKNQIIWGANHFIEKINKNSSCWLVWDKINGKTDFADSELAWTSFKTSVRNFRFKWQGMLQGDMKNKEVRIHPTQKPVRLYNWILSNYSEAGQKILDTHLGSGSSAISAHYAKCGEFVGCELDEKYLDLAHSRIFKETRQLELF